MGLINLSVAEPVLKDLGLEGDKSAKLKELAENYSTAIREENEKAGLGRGGFQALQGLSADEAQAKMREMNEKRAEITKKLNEKFIPQLKETLTAEQFQRVQQISWQAAGSAAFADPELVKALSLSKETQEKITAHNEEYARKQRELFQGGFGGGGGAPGAGGGAGGAGGFQESLAKMQELTKERDAKAIELLPKDQQELFAKLKGKPFDTASLAPQGGGRGFGGPGGPGGGRPGFGGPGGRGGAGGGRPGAAGRPGRPNRDGNKEEKKEESKDEKKSE
jgi:hypothetical protein